MSTKALLIKSSASEKKEVRGKWHEFEEAQPFIQGIETGKIAEEITADVMNSLISGVPSPWARARLFGFAFPYTQVEANISTSGLIDFYNMLITEWKGLLAVLALFPDRITISEPVSLDPKDQAKLFHIPNAFGRMLFNDTDLWSDPDQLAVNPDTGPFIQLIYYAGKLVGATSPYSIFFTSSDYSGLPQTNDVPWYREGKFDDPLRFGNLNNDQVQKIYLLLNNIIGDNFRAFEEKVNSNRGKKPKVDFMPLKEFLHQWKDEIKAAGTEIVDTGTLDADLAFVNPFAPLFSVKQNLFVFPNGRVTFSVGDGDQDYIEVDPKEILLQDEHIMQIREVDELQPLAKSPIYHLAVDNPEQAGEKLYFPLPLSKKGILVFRNSIADLLHPAAGNSHQLSGYIKIDDYKLVVELRLMVDGRRLTPIVKEYELEPLENERNVIVWPNFFSSNWSHYYYYSEFPSSDHGTQMVPFYKEPGPEAKIIVDPKGNLVYANTESVQSDLIVDKLIDYPAKIADSSMHKYEILKSNKPVAGIEIRKNIGGKQRVCGYLVVKKPDDDSMGDKRIKDYSHQSNLAEAIIGIDFGSNNSCLSYSSANSADVLPVQFLNRRMVLLGTEVIDPEKKKIAVPHELYFFQNESTGNGQVKSWVHEHNTHYIVPGRKGEEIAGGVPVFEPNIQIRDMDDRTITTNTGILHHSMKWLNKQEDQQIKKAYLKTLFMHVCADLYASGAKPEEIRWSYPGSFSQSEMLQQKLLYEEIAQTCPIKDVRVSVSSSPSTEAEAVSNYTLTNLSLQETNIALGIDVGGSTSDVLVIAMDREQKQYRLLKQSSLRMAAGYLMKAIKRSQAFRNVLLDFHDNPRSKITIPNIRTLIERPNTSPFFLSAIFDRVKEEDFDHFYRFLAQASPHLFTLPTYITGMLMYYSGQLIAKTIGEHEFLKNVHTVDLLPFGKGGRIFDWLDMYPGYDMAMRYYNDCFRAGYGPGGENISVFKKDDIRKDNKSEVAKGLSAPQKVTVDNGIRQNSDIFGEEGFKFFENGVEKPLRADDIITYAHFADLEFGLKFPSEFPEFMKFLDIFLKFAGPGTSGMVKNVSALRSEGEGLYRELLSFIANDSEFIKASQNPDDFDYKHSMLVLEGMCFLERFLIPEIYKT